MKTEKLRIELFNKNVRSTMDGWVAEHKAKGFTSLKLKEIIEGAILKNKKSRSADAVKLHIDLAILENKLAAINRDILK